MACQLWLFLLNHIARPMLSSPQCSEKIAG
jgi:hypothetical protein